MGLALVVALAFAVGHHAFYQARNGQIVQHSASLISRKLSLGVSDQQINVSTGTFFAFVVKALLGAAVSMVFDQFTWRKLIHGPTTSISVIDDLFTALQNGFMILNFRLWRYHPVGMFLVTIFWLLPLSSVITPATLNVQMAASSKSTFQRVPRVDFTSSNFVTMSPFFLGYSKKIQQDNYRGATPEVQRVVSSTAAQGMILSIQPPSVNTSWALDFHGPALHCVQLNETFKQAIVEDVQTMINSSSLVDNEAEYNSTETYGYLSWFPYGSTLKDSMPSSQPGFDPGLSTSTYFSDSILRLGDAAFSRAHRPMSLFLATFPHMLDEETITVENVARTTRDPAISQCSLYNASYTALFSYINGLQRVVVSTNELLNTVPYIGDIQANQTGLSRIQNSPVTDASIYQPALEAFAYQAVMEEFSRLLIGSVSVESVVSTIDNSTGKTINDNTFNITNTSVMSTALSYSQEMGIIKTAMAKVSDKDALQELWRAHSVSQLGINSSMSLIPAVEEMFRNITISLMSSSLFQYEVYPHSICLG